MDEDPCCRKSGGLLAALELGEEIWLLLLELRLPDTPTEVTGPVSVRKVVESGGKAKLGLWKRVPGLVCIVG